MPQEVLDYLNTQRIGVLAVEMVDGSPHGATVHFAHSIDPLVFYYETRRGYKKAQPLLRQDKTRASFVVGVDEADMKTLQLDGVVEVIPVESFKIFQDIYFSKFTEKDSSRSDDIVYFKFTPTWWRYTDWTAPAGKTIMNSDG